MARVHPYWAATSTEPNVTAGSTPNWGPGTVTSVEAPTAVTFHRRSGSFQALSVKTGETMSGVGPHELAMSEELEVHPVYTRFRLQGLLCIWKDESYRADYIAHHVVHGIIAGEVKANRTWFLDTTYAVKMTNAERTLNAVGISFRKDDGESMNRAAVRRQNVRRAYCNRFTEVRPDQQSAVAEALAREGVLPLGHVHAILGNDPVTAELLVDALLCRRVIAYDLDAPVASTTIVRAAPFAREVPDIRTIELSEAA